MLSIDAGRVVEPEGWADEWYRFELLVLGILQLHYGLGRGGEHERGIQAGTPSLGFYAPPNCHRCVWPVIFDELYAARLDPQVPPGSYRYHSQVSRRFSLT